MGFDEKQLRGFVTVVDLGSIGRAAGIMNMSQPTLSRIIRGMEMRHGVPLFQRLTTGVELTDAGEALLPFARSLLFEMEEASNAILSVRGLKTGVVRIGAVSAVIQPIITPAIARLREIAPQLRIEVIAALDNELVAALNGNVIDLMIAGRQDCSDEVYTIGECRYDDTYYAFCGSDHPLGKQGKVSAIDILPGSWTMPPKGYTPRVLFDEIVRNHALPQPNVVIETNSPSVMVSSVISAGVFGWLPGPLHANEVDRGQVKRLDISEFRLSRRFFVYRRSRGLIPTAARTFVDLLSLQGGPATG